MMMNLKISLPSLPLVLLILLQVNFAYSQELKEPKPDSAAVIYSSAMLLLNEIPDNFLANYGIKYKAEINKATLGNPIRVYTIQNDSLSFTNTWRLPLIIDNEYRALFTVYKNNENEYKVVDLGAVGLANEFFEFRKGRDFSAILRVYELKKDYFMCKNSEDEYTFHPIPNSGSMHYSLNDLIGLIK